MQWSMLSPVTTTISRTIKSARKFVPIVSLLVWLNSAHADCVVLLHGLARGASSMTSMTSMADALVKADYRIAKRWLSLEKATDRTYCWPNYRARA